MRSVIELPAGGGWRIEHRLKGAGWIEAPDGAFTLDQFMPGACRPVSPRDCARLGIPAAEIARHWTDDYDERQASRAKIVHMLKARAWHLAARQVPPGRA